MKKLLILSAMCMAMTAQATVLRVSNVTNSGAPYTTIPAAIEAAAIGDTIMVDGSPNKYSEKTGSTGSLRIDKRLVLMGPGYLLTQNGVQSNGDLTADFSATIKISEGGDGTIIQGFNITSESPLEILVPNVVITRCKVDCDVYIGTDATNCVLHQNLFTGLVGRHNYTSYIAYNAQITNNIFMRVPNEYYGVLRGISESIVAYNTFTKNQADQYSPVIYSMTGCTIEHNIFFGAEQTLDNNTMNDNYWGATDSNPLQDCTTDLEVRDAYTAGIGNELMGRGAFSGDDPYVISGIPAGPVIQDITVPSTVEQGGTLNVTIKLGIQK